jgi:hypothetical protein
MLLYIKKCITTTWGKSGGVYSKCICSFGKAGVEWGRTVLLALTTRQLKFNVRITGGCKPSGAFAGYTLKKPFLLYMAAH